MADKVELEVHSEEAGTQLVRGVRVKNVKDKKVGVPGEIAHYHKAEDDTREWEQACLFVNHRVGDPAGLTINDTVYVGSIVVPTCVANDLIHMEQAARLSEEGIFHGRSREKFIREING